MLLAVESAALTIDLVTVGHPGNEPTAAGSGAVGYSYQIGTHEVLNSQYAEFLNSVAATDTYGLFNLGMEVNVFGGIVQSGSSGSYTYSVKANMGDKPVTFVSFYDAARFSNWLENGQPIGAQGAGTTETGSYTLFTDGSTTTNMSSRGAGAGWVLPTDDEWYKAAYYDPTAAATSNYWLYPTRSDIAPTPGLADAAGNITNGGPNVANYAQGADWNGRDGNVTTAGSAGPESASYYGTFDQGGNVEEWNERLVGTNRVSRGGNFGTIELALRSSIYGAGSPYNEGFNLGFRVAFIPEPCCGIGLMIGAAVICVCRVQRRRR